MSQQKFGSTVAQVVACVAVLMVICGAAALLTWAKNSTTHDVYKAVYHPPTKTEIDEKKVAAAQEVEEMLEGEEKVRAMARAERRQGVRSWKNRWDSLSDEARTAVSIAVLGMMLALIVQLFRPRRGW